MEKQERISPSSSGFSQRSFCSFVPNSAQDLGVAGVRRLAVEDPRRERAAAHVFTEHRIIVVGQSSTPFFIGQEEIPQAELFGLGAQFLHDLCIFSIRSGFLLLRVTSFRRNDVFIEHPQDLILDDAGFF
jgi:hypothetical protein